MSYTVGVRIGKVNKLTLLWPVLLYQGTMLYNNYLDKTVHLLCPTSFWTSPGAPHMMLPPENAPKRFLAPCHENLSSDLHQSTETPSPPVAIRELPAEVECYGPQTLHGEI